MAYYKLYVVKPNDTFKEQVEKAGDTLQNVMDTAKHLSALFDSSFRFDIHEIIYDNTYTETTDTIVGSFLGRAE